MTKFEPDSPEARAWVRFMAALMPMSEDSSISRDAALADAALEEFWKRLTPRPDRPLELTKDQHAVLKSASKVDRVRFTPTRRKTMNELVRLGFLNFLGDGWYGITSSGEEAVK